MAKFIIEINIEENRWKKNFPNATKIIKQAITAALKESGLALKTQNIEVSVLLTNDINIKELNRNYRQKDKPTNVLSFPLENFTAGKYENATSYAAIGDIIFALETIEKEAHEQQKSFEDHLTHLAIHGVLHLIGYDHEDNCEAQIMEALEIKILSKFNIPTPY